MSKPDGLGAIFIIFGLLAAVQMSLATLYSLGRLAVMLSAEGWSRLFMAHIIMLAGCGTLYLVLRYRSTRSLPLQGICDLAFGIILFVAMLGGVGYILVQGLATPWLSLAPALFLLYYGYRLRKGKPLCRMPS
ncbi:MAG: hypothetical protein WC881_09600 [Elusimicrobiota bacterium]|jgi:hypothetical protein